MHKALEILKNGVVFMTIHKEVNPNSAEHLTAEIATYEEAIAELEGRGCDGCTYSLNGGPYAKSETCSKCIRNTDRTDYYEAKK